jgi:hypothetical protein
MLPCRAGIRYSDRLETTKISEDMVKSNYLSAATATCFFSGLAGKRSEPPGLDTDLLSLADIILKLYLAAHVGGKRQFQA